jgi:hypothetical protein
MPKKYLIDEGFLEQALGTLEPLPDREFDHDQSCIKMENGLTPEFRGRPGVRAWLVKFSFPNN